MVPIDENSTENGGRKSHFVIDSQRALQCCTDAQAATPAGDYRQAEQYLLQALLARPSSMLAYHLLSELFAKEGRSDEASLCRKGVLPTSVLDQMPASQYHGRVVGPSASVQVERQSMYPVERVILPVPGELEVAGQQVAAPKSALFKQKEIVSRECFVDRIEGAQFWHDAQHTVVVDANGVEVIEHSNADRDLIMSMMSRHKPLTIPGRVFLIGARGAHNFYHWMVDIVPKLAVLQQAGFTFSSDDKFIVPYAKAEFCREMVAHFGIDPKQLLETEKLQPYLCVNELIVPLMENKMGLTMGPWLPELMKQQFISPVSESGIGRRLFIIRDPLNSDGRQIKNQSEVVKALQLRGFECIQPEKYSVVEQAQLFSEASVIVAAHGAALSHVMFCKPGATVVELYANHIAPCFWAISALCELDYYHLYCGDAGDQYSHGTAAGRSGVLTVELEVLDALLVKAGVD